MTHDHVEASVREIHVVHGPGESWRVREGGQILASSSYRLRAHAMAFARAVAFQVHADMIVHDRSGGRTRHGRASLSYPTSLD
ncbi:MAG: DUF2188 domain-containing protein [Hyphomicrobium sp.]|jgi:hypothetical protein|uniref:DUF2188 domain-containing protein n=1 Tax=Hyphomicrobium sp. TaxID=82 RepID=UPI0025C67C2A|nr:DUF2188 domain-containing protein [Hyphomicrobium sp.]MBX9863185.1 DUF2188 domain-containing protein [Hyphomicrobium sp.]